MTEIDLDRETTRAVDALARKFRDRGEADLEVTAREFMTELRGAGWRPTLAKPMLASKSHGTGLPVDEELKTEITDLKARLAAGAERAAAAKRGQ
jgi:hypothetical protein